MSNDIAIIRIHLSPRANHILTQLSVIMGIPRGQVADSAILAYGILYNSAVAILGERPDLADILDNLAAQS